MNVVSELRSYTPVTAHIPNGQTLTVPIPDPPQNISMGIAIPEFHFDLAAPLIQGRVEDDAITIEAAIDTQVRAVLTLTGRRIDGESKFQPEQASLKLELVAERPRADFVVSTLCAMFSLVGEVHLQIPEINLNFQLNFELLPLREVSQLLQRRQVAYRLMEIERATGKEFLLPSHVSADELTTIAFVHRAMLDRSFDWLAGPISFPLEATQRALNALEPLDRPCRRKLGPFPMTKTILGQFLPLGPETVIIEDGIIQRPDEVRRELACGDGHPVMVQVKSLIGKARYELPQAPRLPSAPWDENLQSFIELESQLDDRLTKSFNALAAATLANLTEEEKEEVTARQQLEIDSSPEDASGDND